MNQLIYRLMYLFTHPKWDTGQTPPEVSEAFSSGMIAPGPALDLGCGTGTNTIYMAQHGCEPVIGLDFAPEAIARARKKAAQAGVGQKTRFQVADVTRLAALRLPVCNFALDMGCFHGLIRPQQEGYAQALHALLRPGSLYMLYALEPHQEASMRFGISTPDVQAIFAPGFEMLRSVRDASGSRGSSWFWMKRRA